MRATAFADKYGITLDTEFLGEQANADGWEHHAYGVTLSYEQEGKTKSVTTSFRMGLALCREPNLREVLTSLSEDMLYADYDAFSFMADLGYDNPDRAREVFGAVQSLKTKLSLWVRSAQMWEDFLSIAEEAY